MNIQVSSPAFSSQRRLAARTEAVLAEICEAAPLVLHPQMMAEEPPKDNTTESASICEPRANTVLIISTSADLANRVSDALSEDADDLKVSFETTPIQSLAHTDGALLSEHSFVVFEVEPEQDDDMAAVRILRDKVTLATRFLAVTASSVTLATARALSDVGFDEVLPLVSLRDTETTEAKPKSREADKNGLIVAMSQTRGGIGATSLALNLASLLAQPQKGDQESPRVAVVDLDYQNGRLGAQIDVESNGVFLDLLKGRRSADQRFVEDAMIPYRGLFDVLPAPQEFAPIDALKPEMVSELLSELRAAYDYVLIDLPRAATNWMEPILAEVDQMLMVTDTSVASVRQARRLIDLFRDEHVVLPIQLIVSQEKRPFRQSETHMEAVEFLQMTFDHWIPRNDKSARLASTLGQPMVECARRSNISKSVRAIVKELQELQAQPQRRKA